MAKGTLFCVSAPAYSDSRKKGSAFFRSRAKTAHGLKRAALKAAADNGMSGRLSIYKTIDHGWIAYQDYTRTVALDFDNNCWY